MNKYYGQRQGYAALREDRSRIIASYGMVPEPDGLHATWHEVHFYKQQHPHLTLEDIKAAIIADINSDTDERILNGFVWEGESVWLSSENQFNFKAAYDLAAQTGGEVLPVTFKIGEDADGKPSYHTFNDMADFTDFYTSALGFIQQCLSEGWALKDAIKWSDYDPEAIT